MSDGLFLDGSTSPKWPKRSISAPFNLTNTSSVCVQTAQRCLNFLSSPWPSSSLFFSLGVLRCVFAVSCLGPGPLCQSLFTHQTGTPADDPRCHPLSTGVEGGHVLPFTVRDSRSCRWHAVSWCFAWFYWWSYFLWFQVSMLGSRFGVLMLFTRVFKQWVLGVIGMSECQDHISWLIFLTSLSDITSKLF